MVAAEQARDDVSRARADWRETMPELDLAKLVFPNASGFDTKIIRPLGRSD
jgi:hypothetical protein